MDNTLEMLVKIYGGAELPVAVADKNLEILWKNAAAEKSEIFFRKAADFIGANSCGQVSADIGGASEQFNVIKYNSESTYYIIEHIKSKAVDDISPIRNYLAYLSARLRNAAHDIAMASDDIDMKVRRGEGMVAALLNRINRQVMLLMNEVTVPEQLYYNSDICFNDEDINIEQALMLSVEDAEQTFGDTCEISTKAETGIFARMNRNTFEVIAAMLTAEACGGELFPERLEFTAAKTGRERAMISVRSSNMSGRANTQTCLAMQKRAADFFDICFKKLMTERYGAEFEKNVHQDGIEIKMEFNALPEGRNIVRSGFRYTLKNESFTVMASALAECYTPEKYNDGASPLLKK